MKEGPFSAFKMGELPDRIYVPMENGETSHRLPDITAEDICDALDRAMTKWDGQRGPNTSAERKSDDDWVAEEAPNSSITSQELYALWEELTPAIEDLRTYAKENGIWEALHTDEDVQFEHSCYFCDNADAIHDKITENCDKLVYKMDFVDQELDGHLRCADAGSLLCGAGLCCSGEKYDQTIAKLNKMLEVHKARKKKYDQEQAARDATIDRLDQWIAIDDELAKDDEWIKDDSGELYKPEGRRIEKFREALEAFEAENGMDADLPEELLSELRAIEKKYNVNFGKSQMGTQECTRPKGKDGILKAFKSLDRDNSGCLSPGEIGVLFQKLGMDAEEIDSLMEEADLNGDGNIQLEEFVEWIMSQGDSEEVLAGLA